VRSSLSVSVQHDYDLNPESFVLESSSLIIELFLLPIYF